MTKRAGRPWPCISCATLFQSRRSGAMLRLEKLSINCKRLNAKVWPEEFPCVCSNGFHSHHYPAHSGKVFSTGALLRLVFELGPWYEGEAKSCNTNTQASGASQGKKIINVPDCRQQKIPSPQWRE